MKKLGVLLVLLGLPLLAVANPYGAPQGGGMQGGMGQGMGGGMHPPGPPPEFYTACKGKREGDTVTVNGPRGPMQGTCRLMFAPAQGQGGMGGMGQQRPGGMGQQPGQRPQ